MIDNLPQYQECREYELPFVLFPFFRRQKIPKAEVKQDFFDLNKAEPVWVMFNYLLYQLRRTFKQTSSTNDDRRVTENVLCNENGNVKLQCVLSERSTSLASTVITEYNIILKEKKCIHDIETADRVKTVVVSSLFFTKPKTVK